KENEAKRVQKLEEIVKKERPEIWSNYNKALANLDKDIEGDIKLVERFFDMSQQDISDYLHLKHDISESPVQLCININRSRLAPYKCETDGFNCFTLGQMEEHIFTTNPDSHKQETFRQLEQARIDEIADINQNLKDKIEQAAEQITQRQQNEEYKKRLQAERAAQTKLKSMLPFVSKQ
ncbi:MAG TPA: hypothetical protein VGE97_09125, partial [Nitrososphaera sp.]